MQIRQTSWLRLGVMLVGLVCSIDTAHAQSGSITVNPPQLTFNGTGGPAQALQVSSSNGPVSFTVSAFSNNNWLQVTPASGTTPLTLSVSIGANAPASGTDVGFVNISSTSGFASVAVIFNASSSGGPSPLSANPTSLSFNIAANSTVPPQNVTISSSNVNVNSFTAARVTNNGGNWLTVFPSSGPLPNTLQVSIDSTNLTAGGIYSGAIAINAPGTNGISIPVLVTVAGTPAINVSPSQLSFAFQTGTSQPAAQTLSITSSTGANVGFTATAKTTTNAMCPTNWIVLSQQSGATPSTITVQVNTANLSATTCTGEIDISAPGASNPNIVIPVSLLISNLPLLQVPSTGPPFTFQIGGTVPAAQNVQITSSTPGLAFTASAAAATGAPNFLQVSPSTGTTPQALALSLNPQVLTSLGPGTYTETVTISATGSGNSPQAFPVTLTVSSNPLLTSTTPALNFNFEIGQATPSSQTITVNSTGIPLAYQVAVNTSSCPGFLSASPASGLTFGSTNQVTVSVNTPGLTAQVCSGNITLTVPGSTAPPLVIPVTLNVSSTPLLNVGQSAINVTALVGAGATVQNVSVTSTDTNMQLPFTAIATTNPVGLTWLSVVPNSGNTPNNLQVTINPANLAPGTYTGSITVSSTATNVPAQTIPVTLIVVPSNVSASPASVTFTQSAGGAAPPAQTVQISGVPAGSTIGALKLEFNGSGWLSATTAGSTVTVTANGSQLPQGTFQGVVTVIVPGAGNSPLYIPVTLTVGAPPTLSVSPSSVSFSYASGSATLPAAQTVQVTSTGGNVPFNAAFTPSPSIANRGNFITVTPPSGTTPATLNLAVNSTILATLSPGVYTGTVTVSSPNIANGSQTVNVTLTVSQGAPPVATAIVNAASFQSGPISPGELVTIGGTNMGPTTGVLFSLTAAGTVPTSLGGVTVTFNNVPAPLLFVRTDQINAIVPYEITGQPVANIVVQFQGSMSVALQANVVNTQPAIFSLTQNGSGQGAILNQDYSVNGTSKPAAKGSVIQIFATGEGQLVPAVATGSVTPGVAPFPKPIATPVTVTIGGQPAVVQYAGEAPTLVSGVLQVNAVIPATVASGNQPIILTVGSNSNNTQSITVAVQ